MKKLLMLGAIAGIMTSCGGSVDACSCLEDSKALAKKTADAAGDADKVKALAEEAAELTKKCDAASKEDAEAWAKALKECK